jgi:hypothetical protein
MQITHRSVGEPAEGSLTRIHVINQSELFSQSPSRAEVVRVSQKHVEAPSRWIFDCDYIINYTNLSLH